ncbi:acyl carrier protein 2, mitochondrial-like [Nymphaea colorata]|uniref:acyl carrier protein 2, mitochondrial-like n=1 Tax=Nymphaea colorata TaxID=210225 RepID=UPI00129E06CF|nr:acyl carrier protein 2, mitochondrial-like [Nymphaea colorata]
MQAARAGARLFRPACNLARAGGAVGGRAAQPSSRVFSVAAYASPATFLEKTEVVDRVNGLIRSIPFIDPAKVTPTANLEKDLQLDMLDTVEVMIAVEEEFAIDIPNSEADKISTVSQLIDYIASHPQAK